MQKEGGEGMLRCRFAALPSPCLFETWSKTVELTSISCAKQGLNPVQQFRDEVSSHFHGDLKGPFNVEDRAKAVSVVARLMRERQDENRHSW